MGRYWIVIPLLFLLAGVSRGQPAGEDLRRAQVDAASADAVRKLQDEVLNSRVGRLMTVREFVERTESRDELMQTLQRAEQIGGPRWLDEQTCQVQLEITGPRVAAALIQIAASKPRRSPVPAEELAQQLVAWKDRAFAATGSSTSANIETVCPEPQQQPEAWAKVDDDARRAALAEAHADAVRRSLESLRPLPLGEAHTVADVLKVKSVEDRARDWFACRPVTRVQFEEDLQVQLTLSAPADELTERLREAVEQQDQVEVSLDDAAWDQFAQTLATRFPPPAGRARANPAPAAVASGQAPPATAAAVTLPQAAPAWVGDQLDAAGSATSSRSKLRAARAAEAEAVRNLADKVAALPLADNLTLADAANRDPRVKQAIDQSLARARVYKTEYRADASATVHVSLDLRDLWRSLREAR